MYKTGYRLCIIPDRLTHFSITSAPDLFFLGHVMAPRRPKVSPHLLCLLPVNISFISTHLCLDPPLLTVLIDPGR